MAPNCPICRGCVTFARSYSEHGRTSTDIPLMSGLFRSKQHMWVAWDENGVLRVEGGRKPDWTSAVKTYAVKGTRLDKLLHACMLSLCVLAFSVRPRGKLGESRWLQVMSHHHALN